MNYNKDHYYRIAYGIMIAFLIPFYVLITVTNDEVRRSPAIILFTVIIIGVDYSYTFPRQAMKLYEEILFKSFDEKRNLIIKTILFISFIGTEIYYFVTVTVTPFFICIFVYLLWDFMFQSKTIIIGDKNIIIGSKLFSHDLIQSFSIEKERILINVNEKTLKIYNRNIKDKKKELESILERITDKTKE